MIIRLLIGSIDMRLRNSNRWTEHHRFPTRWEISRVPAAHLDMCTRIRKQDSPVEIRVSIRIITINLCQESLHTKLILRLFLNMKL